MEREHEEGEEEKMIRRLRARGGEGTCRTRRENGNHSRNNHGENEKEREEGKETIEAKTRNVVKVQRA
jgi:hypothetical protein